MKQIDEKTIRRRLLEQQLGPTAGEVRRDVRKKIMKVLQASSGYLRGKIKALLGEK